MSSPNTMTLEKLANEYDVEQVVGMSPSKRWGRACLVTPRADGWSIADWFHAHSAAQRKQMVIELLGGGSPWQPLLRRYIAKTDGSRTRPIDMPTVVDQARLYLLHDYLSGHAETVLTRVAVAYRRGISLRDIVRSVHQKMGKLPFAAVADISGFFDSITWSESSRAIGEVPADSRVRELLNNLVRAQILSGSRSLVRRTCGLPQGLSTSPVLANLAMREFDARVALVLSRFGAVVRRYCDDLIVLAPTAVLRDRGLDIVREQLDLRKLSVKAETAQSADVRAEQVVWLGVAFGPSGLDVPAFTASRKAACLQRRVHSGELNSSAVAESVAAVAQHYGAIVGVHRANALISEIYSRLSIVESPNGKESETADGLLGRIVNRGHLKSQSQAKPGGHYPPTGRYSRDAHGVWPEVVVDVEVIHSSRVLTSELGGAGAPVLSAPALAKNDDAEPWRVGALARRPSTAHLAIRAPGSDASRSVIDVSNAKSRHEAALLAVIEGLRSVRAQGARSIVVVVLDPVLDGYVTRGWRPRSLRMHRALVDLLDAAAGLNVRFERASRAAVLSTVATPE